METKIMRVVKQGETFLVDSQKSEGGKLAKCNIVLQEFGGKYENQFAAAMLGNNAQIKLYADELVIVKLRFQTHEYQGQVFQDILVQDIRKVKELFNRKYIENVWNITERKKPRGAGLHPRAFPPSYPE